MTAIKKSIPDVIGVEKKGIKREKEEMRMNGSTKELKENKNRCRVK